MSQLGFDRGSSQQQNISEGRLVSYFIPTHREVLHRLGLVTQYSYFGGGWLFG